MFTNKLILYSIVSALFFIAVSAEGSGSEKDSMTLERTIITDLAGRRVSVEVPVTKVVLGYAKQFPSLAAVSGESFLKKIVGWGLSRTIREQGIYKKFKEKFPEIENIPDVGSHAQGTFNVEKVISLMPDMVIFPLWMLNNQYEGTLDDISKLERVGIPTVFIDCWENAFENTVPSILLLGSILGENNRSQEITEFWQDRIEEVIDTLSKITKSGPSIYIENGSRGASDYGFTCGEYAWGNMISKAGGINIADGIINRWGQINPEYLLKISPEVIVIAEPRQTDSNNTGYKSSSEETKRILAVYTQRLGWNTLDAVKSGRIYGVLDSYIIYNIYNFAAFEALAKWFYPDEFKNLDPEANLREFYGHFLPVNPSDAWMIGMRE